MKRILFVDDEPNLLEGLQRLLRPHRKQWDMKFALGAEAALKMLAEESADVIVTDMRMPGMDGAELLQKVAGIHPGMVRIVLSGQFDVEAGVRAVPVAHQFLGKPCDPAKLRDAIERLTASEWEYVPDEATRNVIGAIGALPSPRKTCTDLMEKINCPSACFAQIAALLEEDVALTAKILQLANSAFFAVANPVKGVREAISLMGLEVLKQLILSAEILSFRPAKATPHFSFDDFERHSRRAARIAARLPGSNDIAGLKFFTALLHDVGKLILAAGLPDRLGRVHEIAKERSCRLFEAEEHLFGTSHAQVGAYLLNLWGLPQATVAAIASHHRPRFRERPANGLDLTAVVHIANALAHDEPGACSGDGIPVALDQEYLAQLDVLGHLPEWKKIAVEIQGQKG